MNLPQNMNIHGSRPTPLRQTVANPPTNQKEMTRSIEAICTHGECVQLRPQQRISLPSAEKVVLLREGMLAIDAMPAKGKLQILDFLVAGDVVSGSVVLPTRGASLRAITSTSLVSLDAPANGFDMPAHEYRTLLFAQYQNQLARANIYQMMIGRLETEPRVASFLLGLVLRNTSDDTPDLTVALPMSRTDIANYLVINSDTLSRTMMRFRALGLIERATRHAVRVIDLDGLRKKSPLAPLLSALFERRGSRPASGFAHHAEGTEPKPSDYTDRTVIRRHVTTNKRYHISVQSAVMPHAEG
jgi:CRP/FNR family transcriptional regulator, anaerobic regulatory protein